MANLIEAGLSSKRNLLVQKELTSLKKAEFLNAYIRIYFSKCMQLYIIDYLRKFRLRNFRHTNEIAEQRKVVK